LTNLSRKGRGGGKEQLNCPKEPHFYQPEGACPWEGPKKGGKKSLGNEFHKNKGVREKGGGEKREKLWKEGKLEIYFP